MGGKAKAVRAAVIGYVRDVSPLKEPPVPSEPDAPVAPRP